MAIGDVYQVRVRCQAGVQAGINIRHWRVFMETGPTPSLSDLALEFYGDLIAEYQALLSAQAQFRTIAVKRILPIPAGADGPDVGEPVNGLVAGDILPRQASGLIKVITAFGGRSGRGRTFVPFPGEADNDVQGSPVGNYVTRLDDLAIKLTGTKNFVIGASTISLEPVLVGSGGTLATPLVGYQSRAQWATQRRRGMLSPANPV